METSVFLSNRNQAVRLPEAVALPENVKRVEVIAVGRTRIITPPGESWDEWLDGNNVSADFMDNREQPTMQERRTGSDLLIRNHPPAPHPPPGPGER